jgi:hypothetical protein
MIFRDKNGNIVEVKKSDYTEDKEYYKKIAEVYGLSFSIKPENTKAKILNFIKQKK